MPEKQNKPPRPYKKYNRKPRWGRASKDDYHKTMDDEIGCYLIIFFIAMFVLFIIFNELGI